MKRSLSLLLARRALCAGLALLLSLTACSRAVERPEIDNTAEVENYYDAHPDFFVFSNPGAIPSDLVWEDGSGLPEVGSPLARKGGTYYVRLQDFPSTFRTVGPDSNGSFRPYLLDDTRMYFARRHPERIEIGPTGFHYIPGIAESWALSADRRTVYVKIDPAARWSDGPPITVEDVFFTFFFYQSEYIQAPWYNNWYGFNITFERVTRYDDLTFSVTLVAARPDSKSRVLEMEPIPRHFFRELGEDFPDRYQWRFMPTSGPYVLHDKDVRKGRTVALTRNPEWWAKDRPHWRYRYNPDRIQLSVIRDTAKAFEVFTKGEIDYFGMNLSEFYYEKLPNSHPLVEGGYIHKFTFYNEVPRPTFGLWMNSAHPLLANRDIRVGINYASNWDIVCQKFYRGDAVRMRTTADGFGEFTHPTLKARPFDISAARAAFARAGFRNSGTDGILTNEAGQRLTLQLSTGYEALREILLILKEQAAQAGLEFRVEVLDSTTGWKKVQEKKHEIFFSAFNVGTEMYPRYWETYHSVNAYDVPFLEDGVTPNPKRNLKPQTNNLQSIAIPELDRLITLYDNAEGVEERKELAFRMEEILHEDASFVPGFVLPFYRGAHWRWMKWPEGQNVRLSQNFEQWFLFWIDEEVRRETRAAQRSGKTFPPSVRIFDQYATKP